MKLLYSSRKWWMMIKIQKKDFSIEKEIQSIKEKHSDVGAVNTFIGYVKDLNNKKDVKFLELEVYETMAKKELSKILNSAVKEWDLIDCLIIMFLYSFFIIFI